MSQGPETSGVGTTSARGSPAARAVAFTLTLAILAILVSWTLMPKPPALAFRGRIETTIQAGEISLTALDVLYGCSSLPNGATVRDISLLYIYRLTNLGDATAAVTVLLNVNGAIVAQRPYVLAPHQSVMGAIGTTMSFGGGCLSLGAGLGLSLVWPG